MSNAINEVYQLVSSEDQITLEVTIGFAQPGATTVKVNGASVGDTQTDSFSTDIGTNEALNTKELTVTSVIQAVHNENTSVTIKLSGGANTQEWSMNENVGTGNSSTYRATIGLFK